MRQHFQAKRRLMIGAFGLVAAPLLLSSVAHACTQLINLTVNPRSGAAGVTVALSGSNYRTDATAGPVEIRLNSRSGPVIASLPVSSINPNGRTISLSAPIPANAAVGYHTLIATQVNTSTGALIGGFPVRAAYKVTAVAAGRTASTADATEPAATTEAGPTPAPAPVGPIAPAASTVAAAAPAAAPAVDRPTASPAVARTTSEAGGATPTATGGPEPASAPTPAGLNAAAPSEATATATATATPTAPPAASTVETMNRGLLPAAASGTPRVLPALTLALGLAIVLLSLCAFVKSGRSVLIGRRLTTFA